jgi:hypothetical protein
MSWIGPWVSRIDFVREIVLQCGLASAMIVADTGCLLRQYLGPSEYIAIR